jgi:hypothetical protein
LKPNLSPETLTIKQMLVLLGRQKTGMVLVMTLQK